jgi:hypothetical protein
MNWNCQGAVPPLENYNYKAGFTSYIAAVCRARLIFQISRPLPRCLSQSAQSSMGNPKANRRLPVSAYASY